MNEGPARGRSDRAELLVRRPVGHVLEDLVLRPQMAGARQADHITRTIDSQDTTLPACV